jgi:hypothetical protein
VTSPTGTAARRVGDIADGLVEHADTAGRTVTQALQTFGGYGLTTDYDIHLYNLRAKAWPLVLGDPERLLEEAGRRLYAGEGALRSRMSVRFRSTSISGRRPARSPREAMRFSRRT